MKYRVGMSSLQNKPSRLNKPRNLYFSGRKINKKPVSMTPPTSPHRVRTKRTFKQALAKFFVILFGLGVFAVALLSVVLAIYLKDLEKSLPDPSKLIERDTNFSTQIFDRKGTLLYTFYGDENREFVKISDIPAYTKWAILAAEDVEFYNHKGLDLTAITRAGLQYFGVIPGSTGASTISQQVVKNTILKDVLGQDEAFAKKISRKVKEMLLTMQMEQKLTKDEILQIYLNEIWMGGVNYGFQSAAKAYFGKDVKQLTLAESALLAGMVQSPGYYAPIGGLNPELAVERQKYVLDQMLKHKDITEITQEDYDNALKQKLVYKSANVNIKAPHFVFFVKNELDKLYGPEVVVHGGLKVTTTLDYSMQKIAESEIKNGIAKRGGPYGVKNGALVAIDPKTGDILSMVGSINYNSKDDRIDGNVNITVSNRQMGSSVKPFTYLTAFSQGYGPWLETPDIQMNFGAYKLKNWDNKYYGPMVARYALIQSRNIPAVYTMQLVGIDNFIKTAETLGITTLTQKNRYGLSLTLGAAEMKLLEHTSAYTVFANGGVKRDYRSILEVKDSNGNVILPKKDNPGKRVWDEKEVYLLNWILCDLGGFGDQPFNQYYLYNGKRTFCGKTGTTDGPKDLTAMMYTKSLVVGVWAGNNNNVETPGAWATTVPLPIASSFMTKMAGKYKPAPFNRPSGILSTTVCNETGEIASKSVGCSKKSPTVYISDKSPKQDEREALYICKDTGKVSSNESFARSLGLGTTKYLLKKKLENTLQQTSYEKYMLKNKTYLFSMPEVADCQPSIGPGGAPTVQLSTPTNNETVYPNSNLNISAYATATTSVKKVEFLVDGVLIETDTTSPYSATYSIPALFAPGAHSVMAIVTDNEDKTGSSTVTINASATPVSVIITSPVDNSIVLSLPVNLSANITAVGISSVTFTLTGPGSYTKVYSDTNSSDGWSVVFDDDLAPNGTYTLHARAYKGSSIFNSVNTNFKLTR